jgi:thiol-disulfide isomerase/thioredoxin
MLLNFSLRAPEFPSQFEWLNTQQSLSLKDLRGHVIVLDFWTYCCINCIHILPDLKWLEEKYRDKPFVVIGVHSAKFKNEEQPENVSSAIARYGIEHPVVIDEGHKIWDSYAVRAWPSFVVVDTEGYIKGHFSGEGHREQLDKLVQMLLLDGKRKKTVAKTPIKITKPPHSAAAQLQFPGKVCIDEKNKRIFISDSNHNRILQCRLSSPTTAEVESVIGVSKEGSADGSFSKAEFNHPQGMCLVRQNLFVCDTENHLIRKVDLDRKLVTTVAGIGKQAEWGAIGGKAVTTALSSPWDICSVESSLFVAMAGSHQIWQYSFEDETIFPFAGNGGENLVDGPGQNAQLAQPSGITSDKGDHLFFADSEVSAIRAIDLKGGNVWTLVGHGLFTFGLQDGSYEEALFQHPLGLSQSGTQVFVADTYNHAIRVIDLVKEETSTLIKRENKEVCSIDDKNCAVLPLNEPNDVKKLDHYLYIADTNNHLIRVFDLEKRELLELKISGI